MWQSTHSRHVDCTLIQEIAANSWQAWCLRIVLNDEVQMFKGFPKLFLLKQLVGLLQDHLFVQMDSLNIPPTYLINSIGKNRKCDFEAIGFFRISRNLSIWKIDSVDANTATTCGLLEGDNIERTFLVKNGSDDASIREKLV